MEYTKLTGTGITVSRFCLGTMTFGDQVSEKDAAKAVDYAIDQGVNFFDTANKYTGGKSEIFLGKALAKKRDKVIVATKVGLDASTELNGQGLSRMHILQQVESSLTRLKTDYIDIYYMHKPDPSTPVEETIDAMDTLVRSGKVRYIGASNFAAWQACQMYHTGQKANCNFPVVNQMVYNMITRGIEQEFIPFLKAYNQGMVIYNPIAAGFLTDKYADKKKLDNTRFSLSKMYADRYWNEDNFKVWDEIQAIAKKLDISMMELAMRWVYTTGHVDSILTGFSRMEQLEQNLKSLDAGALPAKAMEACDKVWKNISGTRFKYNR